MNTSRQALNQRLNAFDAAEYFARDADNSWKPFKDRGNAALKRGEPMVAARLYRQAAQLALGPLAGGTLNAFIEALDSWPEGSAQRRLVDTDDILWEHVVAQLPMPLLPRKMQLPNQEEEEAEHPNVGAAIAWANRAQAFLAAGKPEAALDSAKKAAEANPAYLKAHYREMKALEAIGGRRSVAKAQQI